MEELFQIELRRGIRQSADLWLAPTETAATAIQVLMLIFFINKNKALHSDDITFYLGLHMSESGKKRKVKNAESWKFDSSSFALLLVLPLKEFFNRAANDRQNIRRRVVT